MLNRTFALCVALLVVASPAYTQIIPNNSYSQMIVNTNALLQNSISGTIASQAHTNAYGSGAGTPSNWCSPMPPADLQRGMDGHVPPELQNDPRYQEWLHCQNEQNSPQANNPAQFPGTPSAEAGGAHYPTPAATHHLPLSVTDFEPAVRGHPVVEEFLNSQTLTKEQKDGIRIAFMDMSDRVAKEGRPNNLASAMTVAICGAIHYIDNSFTDADSDRYFIAINDRLGASKQLLASSRLQKQNLSDALILQITVAKLLADQGLTDPQARMQTVQLARTMLTQLTGTPTGRLIF